jgi:formylglycine-generating enzyme
MMRDPRWLLGCLAAFSVGGWLLPKFNIDSSMDNGAAGAAAADAGAEADVAGGGCTQTAEPSMFALPEGYCVDSTEVTRDQYSAWLAATPATTSQPAWCSWNIRFAPADECMAGPQVCQGSDCGSHPQVCVDWCDAYAYCKSAGKRLCGKVGASAIDRSEDYDKPAVSQWHNACTSGGKQQYPYGDHIDELACNGKASNADSTKPVASMTLCRSSVAGYDGIYDLSGNVSEWEDACSGASGRLDFCHVRGGSFQDPGVNLGCASGTQMERDKNDSGVGFRCCS